jgi:natural product precursor
VPVRSSEAHFTEEIEMTDKPKNIDPKTAQDDEVLQDIESQELDDKDMENVSGGGGLGCDCGCGSDAMK